MSNAVQWIADWGTIIFLIIFPFILTKYLPTYFTEKAKNLATKEDVQAITEKVESVKNRFVQENDKLKHLLDRSNHVAKYQFDKEYVLYREIWALLVEMKRATLSLRPVVDLVSREESEEERKKKRLTKFYENYWKTYDLCEKHRPFYPATIWTELKKLLEISHKEAAGYRHQDESRDWEKYWDESEKAEKAVLAQIEVISEALRTRIDSFKSSDA